jgi:hypothetical protein
MFNWRTKEEMLVCLKYDLSALVGETCKVLRVRFTYDRTLENSLEGDMTKLSLVLAQEMRC